FLAQRLTVEEIEIICGVYCINPRPGVSPRYLSWWPKPNSWAKSGFDIGYWTSECEDWYQTRLSQIDKGTVKLRTTDAWK
ncbi:hypothetical protein M422DRAFT_129547, partial [Sphaerobolus stellatus SS14]